MAGLGAAEVARRNLTERELYVIIETEVDERMDAAAEYEKIGQIERAERIRSEAQVLQRYLRPAR